MNTEVIGREEEIIILNRLLSSQEPELLAVYGRRRVGKTFLIKTHYKQHIIFSCSGQYNGKTSEQLINFTEQLTKFFPANSHLPISTWQEAFIQLQAAIDSIKHKKKKVIFFDELPWLDSHKSGFLSSFSYFWNNYVAQRGDILVVICGSAASWIIDKVINNKGGLHNRITQRIRLLPFTLKETEQYLKHKNIQYSHYQLLQLYMVMGGIPAYLNTVQRGKSVAWNIENACFTKDGMLAGEFHNLYSALFNSAEKHIHVIQALAKKNKGLTRTEILKTSKLLTGGGTSTVLSELTESGFIEKTYPFGKKEKDSLYRLIDEFSLFYFRFMHNEKSNEKGQWLSRQSTHAYISWCGYAFENICFKHITQIKQAMQIGGIQSTGTSWLEAGKADKSGAQIDLLLDRADNIINLCEMKFSTKPFAIDKKYAAELQNKLNTFRGQTNTRKTVMLTFITVYGVADNTYKQQLVDNEITAQALFI